MCIMEQSKMQMQSKGGIGGAFKRGFPEMSFGAVLTEFKSGHAAASPRVFSWWNDCWEPQCIL